MDVSKNRGTPKWMVYNEKLIEMDDLGVPLFLETSIYFYHFLPLLWWWSFFFSRLGPEVGTFFVHRGNDASNMCLGGQVGEGCFLGTHI